jgi:imidazolonepropionase
MTAGWDLLITDGRLATFDPELSGPYGLVADGAVGISGEQIEWVGPSSELPPDAQRAASVRSAGGRLVTPGLVDCHTHLVFAGDRSGEFEARLGGATYAEIAAAGGGIKATVAATRAASEDELVALAASRLRRLLADGVTTVEVKSGYGLDLDTELRMLRVARELGRQLPVDVVTTFLGAHTVPAEFAGLGDRYVRIVSQVMLPAVVEAGLADAVDAFCETIAFSPTQVEAVFAAAIDHGLSVKLHADQLSDSGGAALAAAHHALSADHLEWTTDAGVEALAEAGTVAVLLPGAALSLGETRRPPVAALRANGVPMAVATDANPGTSPLLSPLLAASLGCVLFGLTPAEALAGVTREAARALGRLDRGVLRAGARADLALWTVAEPPALVQWMAAQPCAAVVQAGRLRDVNYGNAGA